jgi:hypothetical protein
MADDPKKRGKADRSRVSTQPHEVKYQAAKKRRSGAEANAGAKSGQRGAKK